MADLRSILDPLNAPDVVKADAWDAYQQSKNTDELKARLDRLPLANNARAALWDAKKLETAAVSVPAAAPKSVGGFVSNVVSSGGNLLTNLATAVLHPADTLRAGMQTVAGGVNRALEASGIAELSAKIDSAAGAPKPTPQQKADLATSDRTYSAFQSAIKDRYGSGDKILETMYRDPVGVLADLSALLGGAGGAAGKLADVTEASGLARTARAARTFSSGVKVAAEAVNPIALAVKPAAAVYDATVGNAVARVKAARTTLLPEEIAANLQADAEAKAAHAVQVGRDATREVTESAQGMRERFSDRLDDTKFGEIGDIAKAAEGGDPKAAQMLQAMKSATTPDKIQRTSIVLQDYRTAQTASKLYDKVGDLVASHDLGDVPLARTDEVLRDTADFLKKDLNPAANKNVIRVLDGIREATAASDNGLADLSFQNVRRLDSSLGQMIREGHTGDGALIGNNGVQHLQAVRNAVRADLSTFAQESGLQDVQEAVGAADQYYQNVRAPFKQLDVARAATATDADRIFDSFIKQGGGDKAQRYYNALDEKGRNAVRSQMAADAVNASIDHLHGTVDPKKLFDHLTKMEEPYGVFFKGMDKFESDGLRNIAKEWVLREEAAEAQASAAADTAVQKQAEVKAAQDQMDRFPLGTTAAAVGAAGVATGNPHLMGIGAVGGLVKALMITKAGRRLLLAGSGLKPGGAAMSKLIERINLQAPVMAEELVDKTRTPTAK